MHYLSQQEAIEKILAEKYGLPAQAGGVPSAEFLNDKARIEAGEPWQYVLGYADFLGCHIDLSDRPMIPRPETAFWVEKVIGEWKDAGDIKALDLYAGSGNIGVALLKHLPQAHVTLSELDAHLLPGIERSIVASGVDPSRSTLIAGDSLENIHDTFDVICANPPYINPADEADLDPEMRHEPHIAFFGSSDGMAHHRELIERGKDFLTDRGVIYCECDMDQVSDLEKLLETTDWKYEFWKDPFGHEDLMVLRR
ncbi:MAG TPA: HemK family protein methyltransferase [Candidatus Paceibacterota bacterium]